MNHTPSRSSALTKALIGLLIAGCVGITIVVAVALSSSTTKQAAAAPCRASASNTCLPAVSYVDTNGVAYSPENLAGKVVVVNFWATWCGPCLKEIPDLSKTYDRYRDRGVVFLGVVTDNPGNDDLLNFQSDHEMSFPVVRSNSDIMVSYDYPANLPTTFIFDRSGKQVDAHVGAFRADKLAAILEPLVAAR
jgi:thiol-disulfide isomerase/thioredoxin